MFKRSVFSAVLIATGLAPCAAADLVSVSWVGPSGGLWGTAANWDPAVVPANAGTTTYAVSIATSSQVSLGLSPTITSLSLASGAWLNVSPTFDLTVGAGTILNNGLIQLNSGTGGTQLRVGGDVTLSGTGQLLLTGGSLAQIASTGIGQRLTNDAGHTIRGVGTIGASSANLSLTNKGLIENQAASTLEFYSTGPGYTNYNTGIIRANAGSFYFQNGVIDNAGGLFECVNFGASVLNNSKFTGGLFTADATSTFFVNGDCWFTNVELNGKLESSGNVHVFGTLVHHGVMTVGAGGSINYLDFHDDATVTGTGTLKLINNARILGDEGPWCTHGASHTIQGGGRVGSNGSISMLNLGVIEASDPVVPLTLIPSSSSHPFRNEGTLRAVAGKFVLTSGHVDNSNGLITAFAGKTMNIVNARVWGGLISAAPTGVVLVDGNSPVRLSNLALQGSTRLTGTATLELEGTIVHDGKLDLDASASLCKINVLGAASLTGPGTLHMIGPNALVGLTGAAPNSFTNGAQHTIRGEGRVGNNQALTFINAGNIVADGGTPFITDGAAPFSNTGTVLVSRGHALLAPNAASWSTSGSLIVEGGATFTRAGNVLQSAGEASVDGTLSMGAGQFQQTGGTLQGTGFIQGGVNASGGVVKLTDLQVTGNYVQQNGATMEVRIGASSAGPSAAPIGGAATLAGALHVVLESGFTPRTNDAFVVLQAATRTGSFSTVSCALPVSVSYTNNSVIVTFIGDEGIVGDLNGDGLVNEADLSILVAAWGTCSGEPCAADLNGDGIVNGIDLGELLGAWKLIAATQVPIGAH